MAPLRRTSVAPYCRSVTPRKVRKDGTVSYQGRRFEVPFALAGKSVTLVVDPHSEQALRVENDAGADLGQATPLDLEANLHRPRHKPRPNSTSEKTGSSLVEIAHRQYYGKKED